mmetsp:Transcript_17454/g.29374  ORF Transcript_17454/g.29374 Transcript_17454/m.29374 type:complete len:106 (-) Transcript_17454:802-1119(-)
MITLKNAVSPSYLLNNLVKSEKYAAYAKNGYMVSKVCVYRISDLLDSKLSSDQFTQHSQIEWESKKKECTHLNYLKFNGLWYLVVGYLGFLEVYSEDGSKRYLQH